MMAKKGPNLSGTFEERLYQARTSKGWSQSELARRVWGTIVDARGYTVAKNRDRISSYERGKALPERDNLVAVAEALDVPAEELAPGILMDRAEAQGKAPALQMTMLENEPSKVRLRVDMIVSLTLATKVVALLSGGGGDA